MHCSSKLAELLVWAGQCCRPSHLRLAHGLCPLAHSGRRRNKLLTNARQEALDGSKARSLRCAHFATSCIRSSARPGSSSSKTPTGTTPRGRTGGSPKQSHQAIGSNLTRTSSSATIASSNSGAFMDQSYKERRYESETRDRSNSRSSPGRKQGDTDKRPGADHPPCISYCHHHRDSRLLDMDLLQRD